MSKAVLVIDMPEICNDCDFCYYSDGRFPSCQLRLRAVDSYIEKPDWCPLKQMPKEDKEYHIHEFNAGYKKGWNDCIATILGDKQE